MSGLKSITVIAGPVYVEPHGGGAVWGFVGILVVLDSAHASWTSGGKPACVREQLITLVSHLPHCLRRDDK